MSTTTMDIARERQLDWLLGEVIGQQQPRMARKKSPAIATHWLAAAVVLLAIGTAIGVSILNEDKNDAPTNTNELAPPQQPVEWTECHGPAALADVPKDVTNLFCYDFNDQALEQLAEFQDLERLNLAGMDVNERGYSVSLSITDAGVAHLASLSKLRWLSLGKCNGVTGATLASLRSIPMLEHLDLSSTGITSEAIATLPQLPSLRELSLKFCMDFHGRSLADLAKIPGLRRLELSYCPTISAKDALHLAKLTELRYLDLSICCGAFLGQTAAVLDDVTGAEPPPPPKRDGIGITDEVVAALSSLPLETLLLGSCGELTDAIGEPLAKMTSLRTLDLNQLPKTTGDLLANLPTGLRSLTLRGNYKYSAASLRSLRRLTKLTNLGLSGLPNIDDGGLETILSGMRLQTLSLGGIREGMGRPTAKLRCPDLTPACRTTLARQLELEVIDLTLAPWMDTSTMRELSQLPRLREVILQATEVTPPQLAALAKSTSLRSVSLQSCRTQGIEALHALRPAKLNLVDTYATSFAAAEVREIAKSWPGATVILPDAKVIKIPN